jgi:hypothetical protein
VASGLPGEVCNVHRSLDLPPLSPSMMIATIP